MDNDAEHQRSDRASIVSLHPNPDTINKIIKRVMAMAVRLLPVEVELEGITDATSSIITPDVVKAFAKAGGDFAEAVPFCLLRARAMLMRQGALSPADYEESVCRATACEVIARRICHNVPHDRLQSVMSSRFRYRETDGDESAASCALETAIDQHCTIFLSSNEAQTVVDALWKGEWVQRNNPGQDIDYVEYHNEDVGNFWAHLDPSRLSVPRYQTYFKIIMWLVYLFVYSQAVQTPVEAVDPLRDFDIWEAVLYIMTLSYFIEEVVKVWKTFWLSTSFWGLFNFWTIVSFLTDALILTAFSLRIAGLRLNADSDERALLHLRSFQFLACAAPLIWIRLLTVFEGYKTVGVLQVVVFRMLRESAIFFILLAIMGLGFMQALYALDAADRETDASSISVLVNNLIQALLGNPDFDTPAENFSYPFGLIIYYFWNFFTTIILVNVLIALFGTAYSDVYENATDEFLTFFAGKTINMIRAPDQYVYPAPFNLLEVFFVAPFEFCVSNEMYVQINRYVMGTIFFVPMVAIALYESQISHARSGLLHAYFNEPIPDDDEDPKILNPESDDPAGVICIESFDDLCKNFPDTTTTESTAIMSELKTIDSRLGHIEKEKVD